MSRKTKECYLCQEESVDIFTVEIESMNSPVYICADCAIEEGLVSFCCKCGYVDTFEMLKTIDSEEGIRNLKNLANESGLIYEDFIEQQGNEELSEPNFYLCVKCYGDSDEKKGERKREIVEKMSSNLKTPAAIMRELNKSVVGQEQAKKILSVEAYNHYLRAINESKLNEMGVDIEKNNILLTGPSGSGKTFLIENLAKILDIPFVIADATTMTQTGYVGKDVESVLYSLLEKTNMNIEKAEYGIIYIDEIDKIAKVDNTRGRDSVGEGVQHSLLKMVEGSEVDLAKDLPDGRKLELTINTKNILFICGGAFNGIEELVSRRKKVKTKKASIGFNSSLNKDDESENISKSELRKIINSEDLKNFGLIPEFIGRFPVIANLSPLTKPEIVSILKLENGSLNKYKALFKLQNKELHFEKEAVELIADIAMSNKLGARGVKSVLNKLMIDLMFKLPESKIKKHRVKVTDIERIKEDLTS